MAVLERHPSRLFMLWRDRQFALYMFSVLSVLLFAFFSVVCLVFMVAFGLFFVSVFTTFGCVGVLVDPGRGGRQSAPGDVAMPRWSVSIREGGSLGAQS